MERYRYGDKDTLKLLDFTSGQDSTDYCEADKTLNSAKSPLREFKLKNEETGDTANYYELQSQS